MTQTNILDLTLAEVKDLVADGSYQWKDRASCNGMDNGIFVIAEELRGKNQLQEYKKAIEICKQCEVRSECLAYAVQNSLTEGVWGGLIPFQRKGLKYFSTMREIFKKRDKKK